jgi:hypothetical protein
MIITVVKRIMKSSLAGDLGGDGIVVVNGRFPMTILLPAALSASALLSLSKVAVIEFIWGRQWFDVVDDEDIENDALAVLEARFSLPVRLTLGDFIATCVCL